MNCPTGTFPNTDGHCEPCQAGCYSCDANGCSNCTAEFFNDRSDCIPISECDWNNEYQFAEPTLTTDTECASLQRCGDDHYESVAQTRSTDRICSPCEECDKDTERRVAGTCSGNIPGDCEFINLCTSTICGKGTCFSLNGSTIRCDCIGTGYCGDNCEIQFENGDCPIQSSSINDAAVAAGAATGIAVIILITVILVLFVLRREGIRARNVYIPSQDIRCRAKTDEWELDRSHLVLGKVIGDGHFGTVSRGLLQHSDDGNCNTPAEDVAVKQLKGNANGTSEEEDFFKEMELMKSLGRHKHIMSLVGVCTIDDPILLVIEFAELGDLKNYLRSKRPTEKRPALLSGTNFVDFSAQIASGMSFLEQNKIVHRDLAARNVLVAEGNILKVSDFGLARE